MTKSPVSQKPSPWAIGLLVLSSGFALLALGLIWTGFSPV